MSKKQVSQADQFFAQNASLLLAKANPSRLAILRLISTEQVPVNTLSVKLRLSQSATSQHLAKLKKAGLVRARRKAQTVFYSLSSTTARKLLAELDDMFECADASRVTASPS